MLRPELAGEVSGIKAAARLGLRLVNREPGAEARSLLDRELTAAEIQPSQLPGYNTQATGHLHVAAAIAAGLADAGIASEPAALAYGLAFIPLASEHSTLSSQPRTSTPAKCKASSRSSHPPGFSTRSQTCPDTTQPAAGNNSGPYGLCRPQPDAQ